MKLLDYNAVLKDLQYKPNFGYGAYEYDGQWWIRVVMLVENSRNHAGVWELTPHKQDEDLWYLDRFLPTPSNVAGYSPSRAMIEIFASYPIPLFGPGDEIAFIGWMRFTFLEMEKHELGEWLRYQGELIDDPHKEKV